MSWSVLFSVIAMICGVVIIGLGIKDNDKVSLICGSIIIGLQIASILGKLLW